MLPLRVRVGQFGTVADAAQNRAIARLKRLRRALLNWIDCPGKRSNSVPICPLLAQSGHRDWSEKCPL